MSVGVDTAYASKVQAAFGSARAEQDTTSSYADVPFTFRNSRTKTVIPGGYGVRLRISAKSTTQDSFIKVLAKTHPDDSDWVELVAETGLTAGSRVDVFSDVFDYSVFKVQIKEDVAGGSVEVSYILK